MAPPWSLSSVLTHQTGFLVGVVALALGACSDGQKRDGTTGGGGGITAGSGAQSASGAQPATGGQPGAGGQFATGGGPASGGQLMTGGTMGESGGTTSGGASGGATSAGGTTSGGAASGGAASGGTATGGTATGGTAGSGGTSNGECTRELLDSLLDDYLTALSVGDPSSLPLSANVKFTENAQESEIGTTAFWMKAGDTKYTQRALDTTACSVAAQAVIPEDGLDLPVALRIKVEGGEMTEIETIVVRPGDYTASFAVASDPAAIIAAAGAIGWHDIVPIAERATREELISWIDKYFRAFPSGVCDVTGSCRRLENGGGNFSCGDGASCSASSPASGGTFTPRVILADEERCIAIGLTIFDFQTTGHLDMHMMKMSGGQVHAVHAILRNTNGQSGWD